MWTLEMIIVSVYINYRIFRGFSAVACGDNNNLEGCKVRLIEIQEKQTKMENDEIGYFLISQETQRDLSYSSSLIKESCSDASSRQRALRYIRSRNRKHNDLCIYTAANLLHKSGRDWMLANKRRELGTKCSIGFFFTKMKRYQDRRKLRFRGYHQENTLKR